MASQSPPAAPSVSQSTVQALIYKVQKLETQVKKMRKQFRPLKPLPVRDATIPLLPSAPNPKIFLYFNNFPRRAIYAVKSMLRNGYSLDCRGANFSFIGSDILEVLIGQERSASFVQEMTMRGHRQLPTAQAYSGWQVKLPGSATECREYARVACTRRWMQLKAHTKDRGTFKAYSEALASLAKDTELGNAILSATAPEFHQSAPSPLPQPSSTSEPPPAKRQKPDTSTSSSKPSATSDIPIPSSSSKPREPSKKPQESFLGFKRGFLGTKGGGLFGESSKNTLGPASL